MKSIADQLPPETARQIHPDRRKNEAACRAARDQSSISTDAAGSGSLMAGCR